MVKKMINNEPVNMHEVSNAPVSLWRVAKEEQSFDDSLQESLIQALNDDVIEDEDDLFVDSKESKTVQVATASLNVF